MRKRRGLASAILGLIAGLLLGSLIMNHRMNLNNKIPERRKGPASLPIDKPDSKASNFVFVGVMTAEKYLSTRAKAVYETWGKQVPGQIAFFSSEVSQVPSNCPDLPLVPLSTVDDSYPPQKKSFLMLQYMWTHFGDKFEWFLRADDDVYIRTDKLEQLLRSVNSDNALYVGQAGRGNNEEFGLLSLEYDENFCMGGPGVLLSKETLKKIVPHIKYCLANLYTTHEDVELGRCVRKFAGIPCTWNYEMQAILYHNSSGDQAFTGNLKRKEVHRAITLHPIKSPPYMYRLHNYIKGLKIQQLQQERIELHRDMYNIAKELRIPAENLHNYKLAANVPLFPFKQGSDEYPGDTRMLGVPARLEILKVKSLRDVPVWDFISRSEYSLIDLNPRRRIHNDVKEGLQDVVREVMTSINSCSRQRGRVVEERATLYGYRKVDVYGADTILDLLLVYRKYRGKKVTLPVRRHLYLHQHFTGIEMEEVENLIEDQSSIHGLQDIWKNSILRLGKSSQVSRIEDVHINLLLPLSGRYQTFERFLNNYQQVCLETKQNTLLTVILYPSKNEHEMVNRTLHLIKSVNSKYPNNPQNTGIRVILGTGNFSRARALDFGLSKLTDRELAFFIDVDIIFSSEALQRVRYNTIMNQQIYFPIVFSQYDPKIVDEMGFNDRGAGIDEINGYWRQFGFGIVSLYKKDYTQIGGFDLTIQGWGKEDVDFFEKVVKSDLEVFRSVDTSLVHVYHDVDCDRGLSPVQLSMCRGTRADTFASTKQLANFVYQRPDYLEYARIKRLGNKVLQVA